MFGFYITNLFAGVMFEAFLSYKNMDEQGRLVSQEERRWRDYEKRLSQVTIPESDAIAVSLKRLYCMHASSSRESFEEVVIFPRGLLFSPSSCPVHAGFGRKHNRRQQTRRTTKLVPRIHTNTLIHTCMFSSVMTVDACGMEWPVNK